jgi:hypothetical protein
MEPTKNVLCLIAIPSGWKPDREGDELGERRSRGMVGGGGGGDGDGQHRDGEEGEASHEAPPTHRGSYVTGTAVARQL